MKILMTGLLVLSLLACQSTSPPKQSDGVLAALYQQHSEWRGTPYRLGGYDRSGIDCSGFVALTMADLFAVSLPRTTLHQSKLTPKVSASQLQTGDLVFFKIPGQGKTYHVGIYLEQGRFLHASTSRGVMISALTLDYWSRNFWQAVRILP